MNIMLQQRVNATMVCITLAEKDKGVVEYVSTSMLLLGYDANRQEVWQETAHVHQQVPGPYTGALAFLLVHAASAGQPFDLIPDADAESLVEVMGEFIGRPETGTIGLVQA